MNLTELKKLIRIFETSKISELEIERDGSRVAMKKPSAASGATTYVTSNPTPHHPHVSGPAVAESALPGVGSDHTPEERSRLKVITSPMVGTFYRSSSPTTPPFVEVGKTVKVGDVVCIIEAMKLMNEIEADVAGKIVKVFPENSQPVEFGEPLFEIDPS
jgi:acetyl-CoA carboxylase biotin carboxyl carrier protein